MCICKVAILIFEAEDWFDVQVKFSSHCLFTLKSPFNVFYGRAVDFRTKQGNCKWKKFIMKIADFGSLKLNVK